MHFQHVCGTCKRVSTQNHVDASEEIGWACIAQWGRGGYVARPLAALPPELTGVATAAPLALTSCSVCLDDFTSDLPHPDLCSPCPRERWACPAPRLAHFVCLTCDVHIQARANNRCPECRADRAVILSDV